MTALFVAIVVIIMIIGALLSLAADDTAEKTLSNIAFIVQTVFVWSLVAMYIAKDSTKDSDKPAAIDVYRGITELQIIYRDTIPVDTVVIFKPKTYKQ